MRVNLFLIDLGVNFILCEPTLTIEAIHDRMPLILGKHEVENWLYDDYFSREKLRRGNSCMLEAVAV